MRAVGKEGWFEEVGGGGGGGSRGWSGVTVSPGCAPAARNAFALSRVNEPISAVSSGGRYSSQEPFVIPPICSPTLSAPRLRWHYRTRVGLLDFQPPPRQWWPIVAGVTKREEKHAADYDVSPRLMWLPSTRSGVSIWLGMVTSTPSPRCVALLARAADQVVCAAATFKQTQLWIRDHMGYFVKKKKKKNTQRNHWCSSSSWFAASWTALPLGGHSGRLLVRSAFCLLFFRCWFVRPQTSNFLLWIYLLEITERSVGDVSQGLLLTEMQVQNWARLQSQKLQYFLCRIYS